MVNPFLSGERYDTETAIMLEQALVSDIGNAVAYTDGNRIFINTPDNLFKILPAYDDDMLKWLLWHERMHKELRHHNRFFKYLEELNEQETMDEFQVTKSEVNIIMDILVHDWMSKKFPELVPTAEQNLAQFRNRNSLSYTFKTNTLEEMLKEYAEFKHKDDPKDSTSKSSSPDDREEGEDEGIGDTTTKDDKTDETGDSKDESKSKPDPKDDESEQEDDEEESEDHPGKTKDEEDKHDETDWSKLEELDDKEFITESEGDGIEEHIHALERKIRRLAAITKTLNGLVTTTKTRSYKTPSYMMTGQHTIFKGQSKGKTSLYLVFDASGSMSGEMNLFKEIISKAVPQAMRTPTEWFSGYGAKIKARTDARSYDYYKSTFADFMPVEAYNGYNDDGDRVIELCLAAEQAGYSPIGVTDGGGGIYYPERLKQLKHTVLVGSSKRWLNKAQSINPHIQTLWVEF